ncbi:MAG: AMP-binding protein [Clostridiales bacterium]|nr:AMP-binding protein [Clostridiales bacterium]
MENVNKYAKLKINEVRNSAFTFQSLFDVIHSQGDRIFCEYTRRFQTVEVSYPEFKSYALKTATFLSASLSSCKGEYVGLYMENCVNFVAAFWAILMLGCKPLLLNARLPVVINQKVLSDVNCKVVVANESLSSHELTDSTVYLESGVGLSNAICAQEEFKDFDWANEIALTTTATTLNVKVCTYTGKEITNEVLNAEYIIAHSKQVKQHYKHRLKLLAFLPLYHIFGLIATYFWFGTFGRTFVFLSDYSTNTLLNTVKKHQVTHVFAVPLLWHSLHREIVKQVASLDEKQQRRFEKGVKLSLSMQNAFPSSGLRFAKRIFREVQDKTFGPSVKFAISGGGYVSPDALKLVNAIGYPLYNGYGTTEIGITSVELRSRPKYRMKASVGKPLPTVSYKIQDDVLSVKGSSLCSTITSNGVTTELGDNWYNTNDIARVEGDGYYFIDGRRDDVFVGVNGEKLNPDLVEKQLKFTTVNNYCVLGLDVEGKQRLSLVVQVPNGQFGARLKRIVDEITQNVEALAKLGYSIEAIFLTSDAICNENAIKVSRKALLRLIDSKKVQLTSISELNLERLDNVELLSRETCDGVKKIMATILNRDVNDVADNAHFVFDLGGTSLDYCTLLVELKKAYGVEFDLQDNSCATAAEFSNYIISHLK